MVWVRRYTTRYFPYHDFQPNGALLEETLELTEGKHTYWWNRWFLVCIDHHYQSFSERSADLLELIIFQFASIIFVIFCLVFQ